ncbi:MAG: TlpA disulfide reductase family protein [Acidobacteriota bacterium]
MMPLTRSVLHAFPTVATAISQTPSARRAGRRLLLVAALPLLAALIAGCGKPLEAVDVVGDWRAVLASPGGELPFTIRIEDGGDWLRAVVINGDERAPVTRVDLDGGRVTFHFEGYDATIESTFTEDGRLEGRWRKTTPEGESALDFVAEKDDTRRFLEAEGPGSGPKEIDGNWAVTFTDEDGSEAARGEFTQTGQRVTGTFLTPTGDYRFLEGRYANGLLRLSTFDGAHAFLFTAEADATTGELKNGHFYSRDVYHATWTARRLEGDEQVLPDAWEQVGLTNDEGRFAWSFDDVDGKTFSSDDPRFRGKVTLVNLFGTWCPNCNDEAPLLAAWYKRYQEDGLEIVGLAYEFTGDVDRDRAQLRRFAERYAIAYPLLLAGVSDKQAAAETVPDLTGVIAYPTTVFIGRDGKVRKIHSGFAGPGTGRHHSELVSELEGLIRDLLAESASRRA